MLELKEMKYVIASCTQNKPRRMPDDGNIGLLQVRCQAYNSGMLK